MTATIQSAYCKATASYTSYTPYPDSIELNIDITGKSWYSRCYWVKITTTYDNSSSTYTTTSMDGTGKLKYIKTTTDPGDNSLHSYQIRLDYYTSSSQSTRLGYENAVNYYKNSDTYYYMRGHMGRFSVTESEWTMYQTYPLADETTAYWELYPTMDSTYAAIDVKHTFGFIHNRETFTVATGQKYIGWSSWLASGKYKNELTARESGIYYLTYEFTYYPGTVDSTGQYIPLTYSSQSAHTFTVYEQVEPTFKISQVQSTGYGSSSGWVTDTAPYEGKAPYRVTWYDTTIDTNPYALPQASIVWNFGDPDSGSSNQASQTNSGTSLIRATSQTHDYSDYSRYTCTMTVTDKRGNVLSSTQSFSPSTKQRQFNSPTLTPLTGTQPLLCTGTADVTGSPEPTIKWKYTLQGTSSSPYSGEVYGTDVEISLLKEGTYSVVYTATLEGVETTRTFTVQVSAGTVTPDDSQTMHDFDLIILNANGNAIDWCKQHSSIQYIEYYQDLDVFSFEIPQTYEYAQYLQEGNYLILGYKGFARLMQVTYRGRNNGTITISGESAFPERIAITATKSTANDGYDVQTCNGEALIRYWITTCLVDPYPDTSGHVPATQPRGADFVVFGADQGRPTGESTTYSARYDKLRDIVNDICKASNLGYTICARQSGLTKAGMIITEGTDRTYSYGGQDMVVFSPKRLKNCTIESDQSALSRNVSIGAGAGVGNYRTYSYSGEETTTGFNRREMFTDAGDSADSSEVTRMSELALKEDRQLSIRIRVLPTCQWTFGTDYDVGDVVTLESPDRGSLDLQIYSAEYCRRATGDELYLNLGYECASAPTLIRRTAKENTYARK